MATKIRSLTTKQAAASATKGDLSGLASPATATPTQVCEYRSAKRSRLDLQEVAVPVTCQAKSRHVESWLIGVAAQIKIWVADLGSHHPNCLEIPTDAVLRLSIAVLRVFLHSTDLAGCDIPSTRPAAAAALWASIKFFAARKSLPSASFMSTVVGVDKAELVAAEVFLLELINWDVCALARSAGLDI